MQMMGEVLLEESIWVNPKKTTEKLLQDFHVSLHMVYQTNQEMSFNDLKKPLSWENFSSTVPVSAVLKWIFSGLKPQYSYGCY